ncbi:chromosome replication initiation inhibitor protein [Stutzerimonas stutzeri]|jgi:LysR family transcriptional regulator (chromosome initiation inhibitor)|uniref:HTH-type transcriptional regulator ArgP n=1 Tax=Stutzerimonas stutzeri subgroup TaxID=578833 RepID=UPI000627FA22|nr:HTH-type transcriptional regulator ArgP [Stutzerimonas kunmingensis]KKJ94866.1 chromosome replication initiation inhibitor protein [Stutzerimonas stutzeri]MAF87780.1 ArgP/LysG family DNA-binding transcriptional regulator [Pseudomonas sp.]MAK87154.1 ArgP/LysG family DNA-binding transcriptional regulator [Pseudomonas sp.]MBD3876937.1 HTH-type transcriptional regulator ArgP [Stutzerimonas kunmingensis]HAG78190.1 ArgP/LysG family DNA-binding transcriptional regulator [Pseudomonas sp.]|tara:strand:+ start:5106 stop:5999 length:894 start_codon:yes stop_codon:yes gene_type:complete
MNLDPKQTEAFRTVIRTGSFEQAAQRLHLTPPAISQRVRALESALGSALVVRSRPCRPTETGQRLLQYLKRATLLEADLLADLAERSDAPLVVVAALNADSLGTWFFPALAEVLIRERALLDLTVEDQDHTYSLLETGLAIGCISTEPKPMRGCTASPLGSMRYRLVASSEFRQKHFANGLTRNAARKAPVVAYTRKDTLQSSFLLRRFGLPEGAYPCHFVPGAEPHFSAIRYGLGYGMVPELLLHDALQTGEVVDLATDEPLEIALYWHTWKVQSPRMEHLPRQIIEAAPKILARP